MSSHTDIIHGPVLTFFFFLQHALNVKSPSCCLCYALMFVISLALYMILSSSLHNLSYYITSFKATTRIIPLIMYLMSSASLSLTLSLSTSAPVSSLASLHLVTWIVCLPEQNQRRVLGLWRHAPHRGRHCQQAGDLIAGPACFIHQAAERHCQNPSLRRCWKDFARCSHVILQLVNDVW